MLVLCLCMYELWMSGGKGGIHAFLRGPSLFARLWHWGLVRNIWCGSPNDLHQPVRILLHFTYFCIRRQVRHPPLRTMGACFASCLD